MHSKQKIKRLAGLKARLVARGISQKDFAQRHGYSLQTVSSALNGRRAGRKANTILEHIARL